MRKEAYCLSCRKNTENTNPKIVKSKTNRSTMLSKFAIIKSLDLFHKDLVCSIF